MSDAALIAIGLAGCTAIVVIPVALFSVFGQDARTLRALRKHSLQPVAEIPEGTPGKFAGIVEPFEGLTRAPISGIPCVYFQLVVRREPENKRSAGTGTVFEDRGGVPFIVRDASGTAVVDPANARTLVTGRTTELRDADALEAYLVGKGRSTSWFLSPDIAYRESLIEPGDTVEVLGAGTRDADPDGAPDGYRGAMPTRLRVADGRLQRLLIREVSLGDGVS